MISGQVPKIVEGGNAPGGMAETAAQERIEAQITWTVILLSDGLGMTTPIPKPAEVPVIEAFIDGSGRLLTRNRHPDPSAVGVLGKQ